MTAPIPLEIKLHQQSKLLELTYPQGSYFLPAEYLRIFSPSAESRGHGAAEIPLITAKQDVAIQAINPVGYYAVKLIFSDGHSSGLYTWEVLHDLALHQREYWQNYLNRLQAVKSLTGK